MTSNTGPILVFPRIQLFGSVDFSSRDNLYSRHVTGSVNCENSSVSFVMKYCPTSTVVRNPASVQNKVTRFCCDSLPLVLGTFAIDLLLAQDHRSKVCLSSSHLAQAMGQIVLPAQVSPVLAWQALYDCSVDTELINRNNCAKNSFNRITIGTQVC